MQRYRLRIRKVGLRKITDRHLYRHELSRIVVHDQSTIRPGELEPVINKLLPDWKRPVRVRVKLNVSGLITRLEDRGGQIRSRVDRRRRGETQERIIWLRQIGVINLVLVGTGIMRRSPIADALSVVRARV